MSNFSPSVLDVLTSGAQAQDKVFKLMPLMGFNDSKTLGVVHGFTGINDPTVHSQEMYQAGRLIGARYLDSYRSMQSGSLDKSE